MKLSNSTVMKLWATTKAVNDGKKKELIVPTISSEKLRYPKKVKHDEQIKCI